MKIPRALSLLAVVMGGILGVAGAVVASPVSAAEHGGIDPGSIEITRIPAGNAGQPLTVGDTVRVWAAWSVPDGTVAGYQFSLELPAVFSSIDVTPFDLKTASGESMGECTLTGAPPTLRCTLNASVEGKSGVHGTLWSSVRASKATESAEIEVVIDGEGRWSVPLPGGKGSSRGRPARSRPLRLSRRRRSAASINRARTISRTGRGSGGRWPCPRTCGPTTGSLR